MGKKSKRFGVRTSPLRKRRTRQEFINLFNANPCNKLPGRVLTNVYRADVRTAQLNALARTWVDAYDASRTKRWP